MSNTLSYTTINHIARKKMGLSLNEYAVADLIYHLQSNPDSSYPNWCYASKQYMAENLDFSLRTIHYILTVLEKATYDGKYILEKNPVTKHLKMTNAWYDNVIMGNSAKIAQGMQNLHPDSAKIALTHSAKIAHYNNNIDNNNYKDIIKRESREKSTHPSTIIDSSELEEIATKYQVPMPFVQSVYEDMVNWYEEMPNDRTRRDRNWKMTLMRWVKKDALQILDRERKTVNKYSVTSV